MILAIVGPTAVGKTKLSIELAKLYNGEIINCDAMQIYKGLDIGTAKATKEEMQHIPHHLLSIKEVEEDYSIYDYQKDARDSVNNIKSRGKIPIFVGGSGLYLKSALYDYEFYEEKNEPNQYDSLKKEELRKRLEAYHLEISIDYQNPRRMARLLEKLEQGWMPTEQDVQLIYPDTIFIGLTTERDILYEKINERFDKMLVPLIDEVKPFYLKNIQSKALMTGIGYKELYSFFRNEKTLSEVVEECKQASRNYAKRQYTWFLNQMDVTWFDVNYDDFSKTIQEVVTFIETTSTNHENIKK